MDRSEKKQAKHQAREEFMLARKTGHMARIIHRYYSLNARSHGAFGDPLRGQGRVLALLAAKPKTTQRELSYLLDMRQQSLSELLAKLEEKGFVTRSKSEEDGRVTVVELTEAGAAAAPTPQDMERKADALDCLDEDERAEFERLVDKVIASVEGKLVAMGDDPHAAPRPHRHGPHGHHRGPDGPMPDHHGPHPRGPRAHGWDGEEGSLRQA